MSIKRHLAAAGLLLLIVALPAYADGPETAPMPNRQPLRTNPFTPLPLGNVRASGWLLTQLQLQRDGLTGHAEQVIPNLGPDSAWLGGTGKDAENWEKGPYYTKGLVALAYTLNHPGLKQKAQKWLDWSLKSQRSDGSFGPASNDDWWPRIVMTYALRQYAEATGDPRVLPFLQKYLHYMLAELPHRPLKDWAKSRAGDQIDTAFWVFNRTGDPAMLQVAQLLHDQAYDWTDIYTRNRFMEFGPDFQPRHGVNVAQALKFPPVWYQYSNQAADRDAFHIGLTHLLRGTTLPLSVLTATEMLSGTSAIQGVETCAVVEQMLSDETAFAILGDPSISDALERTAYNALPGAMTKDLKLYQYFTATNNITAVPGRHGFDQDYSDGMMPGPVSGYPCCCYNLHMGWPMLVQHAWMATEDGGLAPVIYAPTVVHTHLPQAGEVTITEETAYPFGPDVHLAFSLTHPATFPLKLRIPAWCIDATIAVNNHPEPRPAPGTIVAISRAWNDGDRVDLSFPMPLAAIPGVNNSISLSRGPLVFSLKLPEHKKPIKPDTNGFVQIEITSPDPWNFALDVDPQNLSKVAVRSSPMPAVSPFEPDSTPVTLQVPGKQISSWRTNYTNRVIEDPPISPVMSDATEQTVTLVPFGAQSLRVTTFPWLGQPAAPPIEYHSDFQNTDTPGWVLYGGSWHVSGGKFFAPLAAGTGTAGVKAVVTATDFTDFTYEGDVTPAATGDTGLIFRVSRPSLGDNAFDGYYVGLYPQGNRIVLGKCSADTNGWTPLAEAKLPNDTGATVVHLRVAATGPNITIFVNHASQPALAITDDTYTHGSIGVRRYSSSQQDTSEAAFANLMATAH